MNTDQPAFEKYQAAREKYWEECTDAEKIDRLHSALTAMYRENRVLRDNIAKLMQHTHHESGRLLQPLNPDGENYAGSLGPSGAFANRYGHPIPLNLRKERDRR